MDCMKSKLGTYRKAKVRAKAKDVKTQEYSFFDENFTYAVEIPTYIVEGDRKKYYSADELIPIYEMHLSMAYNENKNLLKTLTNR